MHKGQQTILKILGFDSVSVVAAEELADHELTKESGMTKSPALFRGSPETQERFAKALDRLAAAIRDGQADISGIEIHTVLALGEWMNHELRIRMEIPIQNGNEDEIT